MHAAPSDEWALDLVGVGKGLLYVNGVLLGRFWDLRATTTCGLMDIVLPQKLRARACVADEDEDEEDVVLPVVVVVVVHVDDGFGCDMRTTSCGGAPGCRVPVRGAFAPGSAARRGSTLHRPKSQSRTSPLAASSTFSGWRSRNRMLSEN